MAEVEKLGEMLELNHDNLTDFQIENIKLKSDLAAAVEVLRELRLWFVVSRDWQSVAQQELHGRVDAILARMEVRP